MSVQDLFEDQSPEEIEELFDAWGQRDFEDIPVDTFFATLKEIEKSHSPQHIDMESEIVGDKLLSMLIAKTNFQTRPTSSN